MNLQTPDLTPKGSSDESELSIVFIREMNSLMPVHDDVRLLLRSLGLAKAAVEDAIRLYTGHNRKSWDLIVDAAMEVLWDSNWQRAEEILGNRMPNADEYSYEVRLLLKTVFDGLYDLATNRFVFPSVEQLLEWRKSLEGFINRIAAVKTERKAFDDTTQPTMRTLADQANIGDDTFRRVRKAAGIVLNLKGSKASQRRYTPLEVDRLIEAALTGNYRNRMEMAQNWASWGSKKAATKPQPRK